MSLATKMMSMTLATAAIPTVTAVTSPVTWYEKLAAGSAQMVLAVVVVAEAFALYKVFQKWRQDVDSSHSKLEGLIDRNTEALTANKASNDQLCHSIERFEQVVERCDHNRE